VYRTLSSPGRSIAIPLLVLTAAACLRAQSVPPSPASGKSGSKNSSDFSQEPAIFEYLHTSARYENDGSGVNELRGRIRVQTQAGLNIGGQLVFDYSAADEQEEIRSVRVLKPDGSIVTAGPDAVQDLSSPVTREAPMYTDARQKHVTVPGVSVGDVVEFDVVKTSKALLPGQFWQVWSFQQNIITLDEQLDLDVPAGRALKIKSPEGLEPSTHLQADRRLYHWATSNLKTPPPVDIFKDFKFDAIKLLEGNRPPPPPHVMISTFQSWDEVASWYAQLEGDRRVPTPEIRAKADELVRGQKTDEAKAQALYYWVSQNIRYVSLSFGVGRYQPHLATEVLANRYGDCKDKATLLEAMLQAEGLHAHAVLANADVDIDPAMPNPLQFDHAYIFLRLGDKDTWLDSTLGVGPFGYLSPQLRNKQALVVGAQPPGGLRTTPENFPMAAEYRVGVDGVVTEDGTLDATVELQTRGDLEVLIRILNQHLSQEQLAQSAGSVLAKTNRILYDTVRYTDFKVINASDISQPVKAQFHIVGKLMYVNPRKASLAHLTLALTDLPIQQYHLLSLLPQVNSKNEASDNLPQVATDLKGPRVYSLNLNLAFAGVFTADVPPPSTLRIEKEFALYESSDEWNQNTFRASRALTFRVPSIAPGDSKDYAAFIQKVVDATAVPATFKNDAGPTVVAGSPAKPKTPVTSEPSGPAYIPAAETLVLYKRGQDEAKRKNWANAIETFNSAVKADPKYADAWRELGRAHMYARQYSDAEAAFQSYLALAPDDHRAYWNMAWALFNEKKYQQDIDLMLKRIDVAPLDGDALFRLGVAYLAVHQPAQAVPVLERSTAQVPKYTSAHFALARAYLETHQDDLALQSFRRVLTLDDGENMMNSVAYTLAEHNSSLDLAEDWSRRSIEIVETELNGTSLSNLRSQTWAHVVSLAQYWDTMGWIKFQQGKTEAAEKYLIAAWQIADDVTIAAHLGRLYQGAGRKDDAIEIYLAGLATIQPGGTLNDDAQDARQRLSELLGGFPEVDARLEQARKKKSQSRTVSIPNPGGAQGIAQYTIVIDRSSKAVDLAPTSGSDDSLATLGDAVRAASLPQSFPDSTLTKLPRLGTLTCTGATQPCALALLPGSSATRLVPLD
jgi:tetratricopeptide (TPR) repeat protein